MKYLIIFLLLFSCTKRVKPPEELVPTKLVELKEKFATYAGLAAKYAEEHHGFVSDSCDATLFTGLYGSIQGTKDRLTDAEGSPGKWQRRSPALPLCYPEFSASEISRDMLLGVLWYGYFGRDVKLLERMASYGESHDWVMGSGDRTRTVLSPSFISTLYAAIEDLGGVDNSLRKLPLIIDRNLDGYQAHLSVLHALLRCEIDRSCDSGTVKTFDHQRNRQPENALFEYAAARWDNGNYDKTVDLLLDSTYFPADRLPTSEDRCEPWLWQRDKNNDWKPCKENLVHSGADFLFVASLILY